MRQYDMIRACLFAIAAGLSVAGCSGNFAPGLNPDAAGPTRSTGAPFGVDSGELETPNSLPVGDTTHNPVATGEGVVGVLHLP